jgi:DNA (cytosine-5)-methyltransferase 1
MKRDITAIGLFSGAGGLDLGAHLAGAHIASSLDFDADSVRTLVANEAFRGTQIVHGDVREFDVRSVLSGVRNSKCHGLVVIGGPPCQPFSKNGYWIKNKNRLANLDPRNMIVQYFRIVAETSPDGFLLENVESLQHPTNRAALESILESAEALGYKHKVFVANAADFGVPQRRKRVFVFGSRSRFKRAEPERTYAAEDEHDLFSQLPRHRGVGEFIERYSGSEFFEKEEVAAGGTYFSDLVQVPPGKNYLALTANAGYQRPKFVAGKRFWNFLLKLHPHETSWTIPAQPGPWVGPFHWTNRRLRVPEVAAIQTFPHDYRFIGSRRSVQRQLGNAVPPLLGKAMVGFLLQNL